MHDNCVPNIHIISTGGTILTTTSGVTETIHGNYIDYSINKLLSCVPGIEKWANISVEELFRVASAELATESIVALSNAVNRALEKEEVDGVVIIHGTDTLEETAFLLHLTVKSKKPVVITGAMRPADAIGADGAINLYNAVLSAASSDSYQRGVIVCMNNRLLSARDAFKTSTYNTDAFACMEFGALGNVVGSKVRYYYTPIRPHTTESEFDIRGMATLPRVEIVYVYLGCADFLFKKTVSTGCLGVIVAGCGDGNYPSVIDDYCGRNKLPIVVRSSRTNTGPISSGPVADEIPNTVPGGAFTPQKARILLQLSLSQTDNIEIIREIFEKY